MNKMFIFSSMSKVVASLKPFLFLTVFLLCLSATATSLFAEVHTLTGQVIDKKTSQNIDFANVSLYDAQSDVPIKGVTTDANGRFTIVDVGDGDYILIISFLGYVEEKIPIHLDEKSKVHNIGKVYLREDSKMLDEVEVVSQGSSMRLELDKKVFTVGQDIASSGGSVTDALNNIPSLDVDQEGNISLRNSESVEIWINGKPSGLTSENQAQVLEQMPAASIKEIEIITNPSAKYSPEGTAGIVNIVMKENSQAGYFGSLTGRIDYSLASPWDVPPGANLGFNINFSHKIVTGYFNAGYNYRTANGSTQSDRYSFVNGDTMRLLKDGTAIRNGGGLFLRGGIDFQITPKSSIGISSFGIVEAKNDKTNGGFSHASDVPTRYSLYNVTKYLSPQDIHNEEELIKSYSRNENGTSYHPGWNLMLNWQYNISKQHKLSVSGEYFSFSFHNDNTYHQIDYAIENGSIEGLANEFFQEQLTDNNMRSVQIKTDYEWKPTSVSRLEAGWQTDVGHRKTLADAWNDNHRSQPLQAYFNDFVNFEHNHALYLTYGNTFWKRLSIQLGLRAEYFTRHISSAFVNTDGNLIKMTADTSYFQLFPSAFVNYHFSGNHELQFNYTRRIDRPRGHQINPRQDFSDSTNIRYGNTHLLPQFSSALELNYLKMWNNHTISAGLFYRFANAVIQNINFSDQRILRNTFINAGRRHEAGVEIIAKNKLYKEYLNLTTSLNLYYNKLDRASYTPFVNGTLLDEVVIHGEDILVWAARLNLNFLITKTFTGQLSARYRSPRVVAQGESSHNYSIDLSLRKTFLNKKLALAVNIRDILNSRARKNTVSSETFWQYSANRWNSRTISLTLTYNFGKSDNRDKNDKSLRQEENAMDMFDEGGGDGEM